jgi:hypothetical protein
LYITVGVGSGGAWVGVGGTGVGVGGTGVGVGGAGVGVGGVSGTGVGVGGVDPGCDVDPSTGVDPGCGVDPSTGVDPGGRDVSQMNWTFACCELMILGEVICKTAQRSAFPLTMGPCQVVVTMRAVSPCLKLTVSTDPWL